MSEERVFVDFEKNDIVLQKNPSLDCKTMSAKDLPSNGLFYPKGTSLSYRLYTFGELKALANKELEYEDASSLKSYFDVCLRGIQFSTAVDKYEMSYYDFLYISLIRKYPSIAKDITEPYVITVQCPHCSFVNMVEVDLTKIQFHELKDVESLYAGDLKFRPITINGVISFSEFLMENSDADVDIAYLATCLDGPSSIKEKYDRLYNLTDKGVITRLFEIAFVSKLNIKNYETTCVECGEDFGIKLDSKKIEFNLSFPSFL